MNRAPYQLERNLPYHFRHHIIDADLPPGLYAQVALADFENDGRPEYVTGQQYGTIFLYKCLAPDRWEQCTAQTSKSNAMGDGLVRLFSKEAADTLEGLGNTLDDYHRRGLARDLEPLEAERAMIEAALIALDQRAGAGSLDHDTGAVPAGRGRNRAAAGKHGGRPVRRRAAGTAGQTRPACAQCARKNSGAQPPQSPAGLPA